MVNKLSVLTFFTLLIFCLSIPAQSQSNLQSESDIQHFEGTWTIDLRPAPGAPPYFKEFSTDMKDSGTFSGIFYDTPFKNGVINVNWGILYFAFRTGDQNNSYYHSGYLDGDTLRGITYSPERNFAAPWKGIKKTARE